jgi:hypothetical protein
VSFLGLGEEGASSRSGGGEGAPRSQGIVYGTLLQLDMDLITSILTAQNLSGCTVVIAVADQGTGDLTFMQP